MSLLSRLYRGEIDFDFPKFYRRVGLVAMALVAVSIASFFLRGLNLSIDFRGGTVWEIPSKTLTTDQATKVLADAGAEGGSKVQKVIDADGTRIIRVQADVTKQAESAELTTAFAKAAKVEVGEIQTNFVGPSWGEAITNQAVKALVVFFALVFAYIAFSLEWRMAVGAMAALLHDIILTVGVYSIFGFEVTPATVVSFLTILGFSLYDTVVVYDRVLENTERYSRAGSYTFTTIMRRSLNQVLMRSVNTTITSITPVVAVLVIGAGIFGQDTLRDFGLALFVGMIAGIFSSIVIAAPVVVWLKEREPQFKRIRQRIRDRGGDADDTRWTDVRTRAVKRNAAVTTAGVGGGTTAQATGRAAQYERAHPPRSRKGSKRR